MVCVHLYMYTSKLWQATEQSSMGAMLVETTPGGGGGGGGSQKSFEINVQMSVFLHSAANVQVICLCVAACREGYQVH